MLLWYINYNDKYFMDVIIVIYKWVIYIYTIQTGLFLIEIWTQMLKHDWCNEKCDNLEK